MTEKISLQKRAYKHLFSEGKEDEKQSPVTYILLALILFSIVMFAIETEPYLMERYEITINMINLIIAIIFAFEYTIRIWSCVEDPEYNKPWGRLKFILTPMAIIDLIAFLPALILLGTSSSYWLRILRVFRLLRIIKLGRYAAPFRICMAVLRKSWREVVVSVGAAFFFIFISAVLLYFAEGEVQPEKFGSVPRTLWWSVATLTTVGYGDVYPITSLGKLFAGMIALLGVSVVALPTGILASRFMAEHSRPPRDRWPITKRRKYRC